MIIEGRYIVLRKMEEKDLPILTQWFGDEEFHLYLQGNPLTSNNEIKKQVSDLSGNDKYIYGSEINLIINTHLGEGIGLVRFQNINWKSRNLAFSIFIGHKKYQNHIYGADILLAAMCFSFNELNMHKILGNIYEFNDRSIRIAERGGAQREAVLRKHTYKDGRYYDMYVYGLIRSEFKDILKEAEKTFLRR